MFGLMQLAAELDNPFRDSGFGFDKAVARRRAIGWRSVFELTNVAVNSTVMALAKQPLGINGDFYGMRHSINGVISTYKWQRAKTLLKDLCCG